MVKSNRTFALTTLATALFAIYGGNAVAADEEAVKFLTVPSSSVSFGVGHWNGDRRQFGIYDNLRDDDTILLLDGDIRQRDDETGTWMTGKFRDLGIGTRNLDLRYERQGDWGVGLEYYQMPRVAPYDVNTGISGLGTEVITVPDAIASGTGQDMKLKTERKGAGLNFNKYLAPNLNFNATFKQEDKEGKRHWGYRGSQPVFAVEPIDSTIRQIETVLDYAGKQFQMTGGYYGSWYDNHNSLVQADGNGGPNYLSLPLDNEAHQFFVNAGYNFTPTTRGTVRVSYTHATQDESIPTAKVGGLAWSGAPSSLDGEVDTTLVQLGLSARPMDKLDLVANLRYHNVDDKTPERLIHPDADEPFHVKPNDYETWSGKLEGTYRLPSNYSVIAGVDYSSQDRSRPLHLGDETWVPYREDLDETTYRIQLRKSLSETLNGSLAFLHSKRDGSDYKPASAGDPTTNEINPVNVADRDRDKWRLTVDWVPLANLGLQFNVEDAQDDYGPGSNPYGLTDGSARLYSVDADFAINQDWRLVAWVSYDETKASEEYNNTSSDLKDIGKSVGLGVDGRLNERLKVGADFEWTRTKSEYDDKVSASSSYLSGMSPLPDIESTATKVGLFAEYALEKNSDVRIDVMYQRWKTDDWTWQFSDGTPFSYGTTQDGTTIYADPEESATFVGVSYRYKF